MTKLEKLKCAFLKGDHMAALSIAAKFPRLGKERDVIVLAHECCTNPEFYRQIGKDIDECIKVGIEALRLKYEIA